MKIWKNSSNLYAGIAVSASNERKVKRKVKRKIKILQIQHGSRDASQELRPKQFSHIVAFRKIGNSKARTR